MIPLKKFLTVSGMTALSRVLGVIREMILSIYLGASSEMDACLIAIKFPKFFKKCLSEEGFNSIFVPYLTELNVKNKNKFAYIFSSRIFSIVFYIMLLSVVIVNVFAEKFVIIMAPGFLNDPEKLALTVEFTRIMFPSIIFLSMSAIYGSILVSNQKFGYYTVCPLIINIVLIIAILLARNSDLPGRGFAYGELISTFCQFIYLWFILRIKKLTKPKLTSIKNTTTIKNFLKKLSPVIASSGVAQINVFIDSFFSSYLFTGCVTYLYFADRLNQLPLALFGISMSIVLLPEISRKLAAKDDKNLPNLYTDSILFTLRLTFPVVVIIAIMSYYFINLIYGHGKFTQVDVQNTALVLQIMCLGLPAYVLSKIIASILFAQKNIKLPIIAAFISICSNLILNAILTVSLQFMGIAIATMISGYVQMLVLSKHLFKNNIFNKKFFIQVLKITLATLSMTIAILFIKYFYTIKLENNTLSDIINIILTSSLGFIVYIFSLYLFGDNSIHIMLKKLRKII